MCRSDCLHHRAPWFAALLLVACGGGGEAPEPTRSEQPDTSVPEQLPSPGVTGQAGIKGSATGRYIVQLAEPPVSAYEGGLGDHAATKPAAGEKLDAETPAVGRYATHLRSRHDALLAGAGGGRKLQSYAYVFNGFAAELTAAQAQRLAGMEGVLAVTGDQRRKAPSAPAAPPSTQLAEAMGEGASEKPSAALETTGGNGSSGADPLNGSLPSLRAKGEDVIIGIIDSGIWPEHPSFSDRDARGRVVYDRPRGWKGTCQAAAGFAATACNRKLIGARYFNVGDGGDAGTAEAYPYEFASPRDYEGSGTHAASVAAGNAGVAVTLPGGEVLGRTSGVAPRARIAAYKACYGRGLAYGCFDIDLLAAIDQAVADGVDVISYRSGFPQPADFTDPLAQAMRRAAEAGIFIVGPAGDEGSAPSTAYAAVPWMTQVAGATRGRNPVATLTLGNGATHVGASSSTSALPASPVIRGADAALPGVDPAAAAECATEADVGQPVLDPAKVAGKVVVCDFIVNVFRVEPSRAVLEAGGVGMILLNVGDSSTDARSRLVPSVHLPASERDAVAAYAAQAGATAALSEARFRKTGDRPAIAADSGRGPALASFGDLLSPDIAAPGQDTIAALAPEGNGGLLFGVRSGTPPAAAHVAGIAALLKERHPRWSPMAIKSALMTSATDGVDAPNTEAAVIFAQGAGHVRARYADDPGLVFDAGLKDWQRFLCGTRVPGAPCTEGVSDRDPSNLNLASIAIGDLAGMQTVTRRVTNVDPGHATYTPTYSGLAGFDVAISPSSLTLAPGQTQSFRVSFTRKAAAADVFEGGQLTWTGGTSGHNAERHRVRIPMVVRPVLLSRPLEAVGPYAVKFGYAGPFSATSGGLVAARTTAATVAEGATINLAVTVAPGTRYVRFALFDADVSVGADLDFQVLDPSGQPIYRSGGETSAEAFSLADPPPGVYTVQVTGFSVPAGTSPVKLFAWTLGSTSDATLRVDAPSTAVTGGTGQIELGYSGLVAGAKYLGAVVYGGDPALAVLPTIVRVDR